MHGDVGKTAGAVHTLAQANDAREGVDDKKTPARGPGDEKAAIIGAEIEGAVNRKGVAPGAPIPVVLALDCTALALRIEMRSRDGFRRSALPASVGLAPPGFETRRRHSSPAGIAARPSHNVQPLAPRTPDFRPSPQPRQWFYDTTVASAPHALKPLFPALIRSRWRRSAKAAILRGSGCFWVGRRHHIVAYMAA